jgi:hypothetical protein
MAKKRSWRDVLAIHPAAEVFPLLEGDEFEKLAEDIKEHGLQLPITLWHDRRSQTDFVIDGRNRLDAMEKNGWWLVDTNGQLKKVLAPPAHGKMSRPFQIQTLISTDDPTSYIIGANLRRRHLTAEQRVRLADAAIKAGENFEELSPKSKSKVGRPKSYAGRVAELASVDRKTARKHLGLVKTEPRRPPERTRVKTVVEPQETVKVQLRVAARVDISGPKGPELAREIARAILTRWDSLDDFVTDAAMALKDEADRHEAQDAWLRQH